MDKNGLFSLITIDLLFSCLSLTTWAYSFGVDALYISLHQARVIWNHHDCLSRVVFLLSLKGETAWAT